jgi:sugar (pentulose or hexulose) kinase
MGSDASEGLYLGFDVGTQATKGVVLDTAAGRVVARGGRSYGDPRSASGAAEQDPRPGWTRYERWRGLLATGVGRASQG